MADLEFEGLKRVLVSELSNISSLSILYISERLTLHFLLSASVFILDVV